MAYEREYDILRAIRKEEREAAFSLTKSGCMTAEHFLAEYERDQQCKRRKRN